MIPCNPPIAGAGGRGTVPYVKDRTTETVKEILARLGVEAVEAYDAVSAALDAELGRKGLSARVSAIRWGCATVTAERHEAAQVGWMKDVLETVARRASGGTVTSVRVRTGAAGERNRT